jgi:hypothetical protein
VSMASADFFPTSFSEEILRWCFTRVPERPAAGAHAAVPDRPSLPKREADPAVALLPATAAVRFDWRLAALTLAFTWLLLLLAMLAGVPVEVHAGIDVTVLPLILALSLGQRADR